LNAGGLEKVYQRGLSTVLLSEMARHACDRHLRRCEGFRCTIELDFGVYTVCGIGVDFTAEGFLIVLVSLDGQD